MAQVGDAVLVQVAHGADATAAPSGPEHTERDACHPPHASARARPSAARGASPSRSSGSTAARSDSPSPRQRERQVPNAAACATAARTTARRRPGSPRRRVSRHRCSMASRAPRTRSGPRQRRARCWRASRGRPGSTGRGRRGRPAASRRGPPTALQASGSGSTLPREPLARAGQEERLVVREVPVDGGPGDFARSAIAEMVALAGPTEACSSSAASTIRARVALLLVGSLHLPVASALSLDASVHSTY